MYHRVPYQFHAITGKADFVRSDKEVSVGENLVSDCKGGIASQDDFCMHVFVAVIN